MAAPGPSLAGAAKAVRVLRCAESWKVIAVQDAYRLLPHADILYGCDNHWWEVHGNCEFHGEKWSTHDDHKGTCNNKSGLAPKYGLKCVRGESGDEFSLDPGLIRYGSNSGFQAINLAILKGCSRIVLVGFDLRFVGGKAHFFGDHAGPIPQSEESCYLGYAAHFALGARLLTKDVTIINATPGSALTCWPIMELDEAVSSLHRNRPEPHERAGAECA